MNDTIEIFDIVTNLLEILTPDKDLDLNPFLSLSF